MKSLKKNIKPTITTHDLFFQYICDYLNGDPTIKKLSAISDFIMRNAELVTDETKENYIIALENFSDSIVLNYYNLTGDDFFEKMDNAIKYFESDIAPTSYIKSVILKRIDNILSNTTMKQDFDLWNNSISDEN
jgi:hypothetical protein